MKIGPQNTSQQNFIPSSIEQNVLNDVYQKLFSRRQIIFTILYISVISSFQKSLKRKAEIAGKKVTEV